MPRYEIAGKGETTGRQRKRVYEAPTEEHARLQAEADGTLISSVVELAPEPPTEGQRETAREHGIEIPTGATRDELSDLISLTTWRDKPASSDLRELAQAYGVRVTNYSGKRLLFQRIFERLSQPGHEEELAAWFAYRVYRELVGGSPVSPVTNPKDTHITGAARQLAADSSVMQSIRRYSGADLVWFGKWTAPNGVTYDGGSNKTIAYKKAADLLRPIAAGEKQRAATEIARSYNERPNLPALHVDAHKSKDIGSWLERTEETIRTQNEKPVKITAWHVAAWAVIAGSVTLLVFGPR